MLSAELDFPVDSNNDGDATNASWLFPNGVDNLSADSIGPN